MNGTYYLNISGSRWVTFTNGKKTKITLLTNTGQQITRTVIFYESFGSFATALISYKGKKLSVFGDTILND